MESAVWDVETTRTVPVTRSASTSNVLILVNRRVPVDQMLSAASSTRMYNASVQKGLQECPSPSRDV